MTRYLANFSCGAASAVATKLAIEQYGDSVVVVNAYLSEEHEDNARFFNDCQAWFGREIVRLADTKYGASPNEVFKRVGYIKGPRGAACTDRLKRGVLRQFEQPGDVLVLGYTAEEQHRLDGFRETWGDVRPVVAPLIERGLTKEDCKALLLRAGIALPVLYLLGYDNNNCLCCVKGGHGYFRAMREDFPEAFEARARAEDIVASVHGEAAYILRHRSGPLKGQRFPLRELPPGKAKRNEKLPSCGVVCETAEKEYTS